MKATRAAERALMRRITDRAGCAEPEELVKLSEAFKNVKWGAQGRTDQTYDNIIRREGPAEKGVGFR